MESYNPFDTLAEEYDAWFTENHFLFESERDALLRMVRPEHPSVEIGAGTGVFTEALGIELGIEPSDAMAAIARRRGIAIRKGVAEQLPLPDQSMASVYMITIESFLRDLPTVFLEIRRVLRDDGHLVLAFLNLDTELGRQYDTFKAEDAYYRNATFRGAEEILSDLALCGFRMADACQTVFRLENVRQEIKPGYGEGLFTVFLCQKEHVEEPPREAVR